MRKILRVISAIVCLIHISGCSAREYPDMPDIVFICYYHYVGIDKYSVLFADKNGDFYSTFDDDICAMSFEELTEKYISESNRFTRLEKRCDTAELEENYHKICDIADNESYSLDYPMEVPSVEADSTSWYGLYFDVSGALEFVPIHVNYCLTDVFANDDRANAVYEWFEGC